MASTTALYTGLTGLSVNSRRLEVIGNNIANANTTAFKSSRLMFETQLSRVLNGGSAPGTSTGGTNPMQLGLGVGLASTMRDMNGGSITPTGDPRDLAIDGGGFFVVNRNGNQFYTRAGSFRQDFGNNLVTVDGDRVQGYGVDANFNIVTGQLVDINLPLGTMKLAQATQNVRFSGNLNASGDPATQGAHIQISGGDGMGLTLLASAPPPGPGNVLELGSLLTDIADPLATTSPLFALGQSIEVRGAERGDRTVPPSSYTITAASTMQDLATFLAQALGINTSTGPNPDGATPGVVLDPVTGTLEITGNTGTASDLDLDSADIRLLDAAGQFIRSPVVAGKDASATGESTRTTFVVFDSLGTPMTVDLTMVLEGKSSGGTAWRYFVDSEADTDLSPNVGTGVLNFDTSGVLQSTIPVPITIDRANTGALTPLSINLNFAAGTDTLTALASDDSTIASTFQDGSPLGVLNGFGVGADGMIVGIFSNGLTRTLGQVALASFANPEGLVETSSNLFQVGNNSGPALVGAPGSFSAGLVIGGALEASNVDLGQEFINMILTSTGYSASSRIIRTTDELLQQLMVLGR
ncbi:MAG: flagellar hook-basal body complex protein [Phycisphaerales bacterium]